VLCDEFFFFGLTAQRASNYVFRVEIQDLIVGVREDSEIARSSFAPVELMKITSTFEATHALRKS
jgi:hypothetical protein